MMLKVLGIVVLVIVGFYGVQEIRARSVSYSAELPKFVVSALAHPNRPSSDKVRDPKRMPGEVVNFFGVKPGMTVLDLQSAGGYYTEILSRIVGGNGKVYAQNNRWILGKFAERPISSRVSKPDLSNAKRLNKELESLGLQSNSVDVTMMVLFYHDTFWLKNDRPQINKEIMRVLKPGGIFGVIDHHAQKGSGARDIEKFHRIDAELVKKEILAAGFEFVGESLALKHESDPRNVSVFSSKVQWKTDRFIYKFRKPYK